MPHIIDTPIFPEIQVEILSEDPDILSYFSLYWAVDSHGKFCHKVRSLLEHFKKIDPSFRPENARQDDFPGKYFRAISKDSFGACQACGNPRLATNRTDAVKIVTAIRNGGSSGFICHSCEKSAAASDLAKRKAIQKEIDAEVIAATNVFLAKRQTPSAWVDYSRLPFGVAMKLCALNIDMGRQLENGARIKGSHSKLDDDSAMSFIAHLCEIGVLIPYPCEAMPAGGFFLNEQTLYCSPREVDYQLAPNIDGHVIGAIDAAMQVPVAHNELHDLWMGCALNLCMEYLFNGLHKKRGLVEDDETLELCSNVFSDALHYYSVSQLWCFIWRAIKDADWMSNKFGSKIKATRSIPGKLITFCSKFGINQHATEYNRQDNIWATGLEKVLFERFGINEKTRPDFFGRAIDPFGPTLPTHSGDVASAILTLSSLETGVDKVTNSFSLPQQEVGVVVDVEPTDFDLAVERIAKSKSVPENWIDYSKIPFSLALRVLLLNAATGGQLEVGLPIPGTEKDVNRTWFASSELRHGLLVDLNKAGILLPRSSSSRGVSFEYPASIVQSKKDVSSSGFFVENGVAYFAYDNIDFVLASHITGNVVDAFPAMRGIARQDEEVWRLRVQFAAGLCVIYLRDRIGSSLIPPLNDDLFIRCQEEFEQVLRTYSVSQVWAFIWRAVRCTEELSAHHLKSEKAVAGKIIDSVREFSQQSSALSAKKYNRPSWMVESAWERFFSSVYGIDDDSLPIPFED